MNKLNLFYKHWCHFTSRRSLLVPIWVFLNSLFSSGMFTDIQERPDMIQFAPDRLGVRGECRKK
jgi:hypothetical protein